MKVSELIEKLQPYADKEVVIMAGSEDTIAQLGAPIICTKITMELSPNAADETLLIYAEEETY